MANTNITQPSFSSGILSTELFSRIDFSKLSSGLKQCHNWVVRPAGGVIYRVGTKYISEAKYPLKNVSLVPFVYNRQDGLCLEFGDKYIRFYKDGKQIVKSGKPYEVVTPFLASEVQSIKYTQYKNKMYLVQRNHNPMVLTRKADDNWEIKNMVFNPDVPQVPSVNIKKGKKNDTQGSQYVKVDYNDWQYAISVVDKDGHEGLPVYSNKLTSDIDLLHQNIDVTFDRPVAHDNIKKFLVYRIKGGKFFLCYEVPYEDKQTFIFTDISFSVNETASPKERFTDFDGNNFPSAVGFWQQRLVLANTRDNPSTFWMSRVGYPEDFTKTDYGSADDSIELTFNSGQVDAITDLIPMDDLIVFTQGKIWRVTGTSLKNMSSYIESYSGSSGLRPFATKKSILYVDSSENTVSNFVYSYELNGYSGQNLDILSRSLLEGHKIKDISFRDSPYGVMYSVREDGLLLGLTYLREENIFAWHTHSTKGGYFKNVCSVDKDSNDDVYVVVERGGKTYIEQFGDYINETQDIDDSCHLDCSTRVKGDLRSWNNIYEKTTSETYRAYRTEDIIGKKLYSAVRAIIGGGGGFPPKPVKNVILYTRVSDGARWFCNRNNWELPATSEKDLRFLGEIDEHKAHNDPSLDIYEPDKIAKYHLIYIKEEISGAIVYIKDGNDFIEVGRSGTIGASVIDFDGFKYQRSTQEDVVISETVREESIVYTLGEPKRGDKAYIDDTLNEFETISEVSSVGITVNGKLYKLKDSTLPSIDKITGLQRFNGQKVTALIDTNIYDDLLVINGTLTLPVSGRNILVGLPYEGIIETIPQEMKYKSGDSTVGVNRKINDGILSYYKARGLWYGKDYNHLYEIKPYTQETYSFDIPLESGKLNLKVADGFNTESTFMVVQKSPLPAIVQSITLGSTYNGKN